MLRTNRQSESTYAKRQRRKAEQIIQATGAYPASVRARVRKALNETPSLLPRIFAVIDEMDQRKAEFGKGLHAFASDAYSAALKYYSKHHDDPAALAAFTRAMRKEVDDGE